MDAAVWMAKFDCCPEYSCNGSGNCSSRLPAFEISDDVLCSLCSVTRFLDPSTLLPSRIAKEWQEFRATAVSETQSSAGSLLNCDFDSALSGSCLDPIQSDNCHEQR